MAKLIAIVPSVVLGLVLGAAAPTGAAPAATQLHSVRTAPTFGGPQDTMPTRLLIQSLLENQVISLTNVQRRAHGCPALKSNAYLRKSARGHTVTMAAKNKMSHQLPGEPRFTVRITRAGYTNWNLVAENVARGFSGPSAVLRAWMASPGHRRNILNCKLRHIGVGVALQGGQLWWTQNFGRR
ncbi:hypothetical protein ASE01_03585 [Nocardioides sp. Root190]|uniref:CAP domain-containing protein n=1 Tax=Nocardioides sp. Root190 TaxID=1736488 RepID=UPI0006F320D1|nr:CAP domain-containing protein [Nocardioides sp. Root190]KRB78368.1 hypothetical protein ASE01_03585 [Nocardioides sp. Root190]